ncbi:MAG: adenylosuccinate lyase [Rickettsiales bacterium]|nr:adenylosuccinate lyase [Rickettsiales bacterium]
MIPRYSKPSMRNIWSDENKFKLMLEVEVIACEAMANLGQIPKDDYKEIKEKASFSVDRIREIEKEVHHDVIAFLTNVAENVGPAARHIHQGMTSSDVLDTAFAMQLNQAGKLILVALETLIEKLKAQAEKHKHTLCIGRSHGIHAEPTSFGLKLAGHYTAFERHKERLVAAIKDVSTVALSGAVGTFATLNPKIEEFVADQLGFEVENHSTQIIPRDRHAHFFCVLANIASSLENLSTEIRHLQRSEVREVFEYFDRDQKGSSAMPHKKNPVLSENITGLARVIRSTVIPALENVTTWHERDISHSSVERIIAPDATQACEFALYRMAGVIEKMIVDDERMLKNIDLLRGLIFSQKMLLALTQKGLSREVAYKIVQNAAMQVWDDDNLTFYDILMEDATIKEHFSKDELDKIFDLSSYLKNIDYIWNKIFKN